MSTSEEIKKLRKEIEELNKRIPKKTYGPKRWDEPSDELIAESKATGRPIYYVHGLPRI